MSYIRHVCLLFPECLVRGEMMDTKCIPGGGGCSFFSGSPEYPERDSVSALNCPSQYPNQTMLMSGFTGSQPHAGRPTQHPKAPTRAAPAVISLQPGQTRKAPETTNPMTFEACTLPNMSIESRLLVCEEAVTDALQGLSAIQVTSNAAHPQPNPLVASRDLAFHVHARTCAESAIYPANDSAGDAAGPTGDHVTVDRDAARHVPRDSRVRLFPPQLRTSDGEVVMNALLVDRETMDFTSGWMVVHDGSKPLVADFEI